MNKGRRPSRPPAGDRRPGGCLGSLFLVLLLLGGCRGQAPESQVWKKGADQPPSPVSEKAGPAPARPNLIIISIDTLRPDHLAAYGYGRPTSPNLDAVARESVVFERCLAQASWTPPSVASLFTSLYPPQHGSLGKDRIPLADQNLTLAEILSDQGYATAAFSASPFISRDFGFGQGFQTFGFDAAENAAALNRLVLTWLSDQPAEPFFLYVMYFDPHFPYQPPPPYDRKFQNGPEGKPLWDPRRVTKLTTLFELKATVGRETFEFLKSEYDGEIAYTDEQIGVLLAELKRRGLLDRSVLVFVSDHGEEFLEHGAFGHGNALYQEAVRILFMLREPGPAKPGTRIGSVVREIDVLPTALELLGIPLTRPVEGKSLVSRIRGAESPADRPAFASSQSLVRQGETMRALTRWPYQFLLAQNPSRAEIYDLAADPEEQNNLAAARPELLRELTAELLDLERAMRPSSVGPLKNPSPDNIPKILESLGYIKR